MLYVALSFRLADVYCAILILHDHDDEIISFELGKKVMVRMLIPFPLKLLDSKCFMHAVGKGKVCT